MTHFFLLLFDYFIPRRKRLFGILCVLVAVLGFLAHRVHFQEDITRFFPESTDTQSVNRIFEHLKVKDKIVVMITPSDSLATPDPDQMRRLCDNMVTYLQTSPDSALIKNIVSRVDNGLVLSVARYVYQHLPVLVHPSQYARIEARMQADSMDRILEKNYNQLVSPQGSFLKEFITLDPLGIGTPILDSLSALQLNDNTLDLQQEHLFSKDGRTLLWFLTPVYPAGNSSENDRLMHRMETFIAQNAAQGSPYQIEFTLGPTFSVYNARQIKTDGILSISLALAIIIIALLLVFRNLRAIPLIVVPAMFGALFALAGMYLIKGEMSFIAVGAGAVVFGIALSYSIHIVTHFRESGSARSVVEHLTQPLTLGGFTTIGAFLSLLFTQSDILQDFGLFSALTLIGDTLFCLVFLPHLLPNRLNRTPSRIIHWLDRMNRYAIETNKWVIVPILILLAGGIYFSGRVKFNNDMMQLHYNHPKYTAATERFNRIVQSGSEVIYMVTTADDSEKALTDYARTNRTLASLEKAGLITSVSHAGTLLLSKEEQQRRIARWNTFWSPERKGKLDKLFRELGPVHKFNAQAFAPFYALLNQPTTPIDPASTDPVSVALLGDWITQDGGQTMAVTKIRINEAEKETTYQKLEQDKSLVIFDIPHLAKRFISIIRNDFNTVLYLCSLIVFVALWISYRRIEMTLMTFLPMACSWIIILGVMGLFHLEFNILNIIISTFIFGLGDDFSIFIMDGLLVDYRSRKHTLPEHKTAITLSAFTTLVGLGALIVAKHPGLRSISIISMIGILSVVLISYTLQPLLFRMFISGRTHRGEFPHTLRSIFQSIYVFTVFLLGCIILSVSSIFLRIFWFINKYYFHCMLMHLSRLVVYSVPYMRKQVFNPYGETFKKPAILIANHQSFIDSLAMGMLYPKTLMFTKKWVWNSPFFGLAIRYADFYYVGKGVEESLGKLIPMVKQGYSVVVFPEGTRSATGKMSRFHKGAFYLSEQMKLDIIPVSLIGFNEVMSKTDGFYLKDGGLTVHIGKRIAYTDRSWGNTYQERCKKIAAYHRKEFAVLQQESQDTDNPYYRFKLRQTYAYKGISVERALSKELKVEQNYRAYHRLISRSARICELGCGYGFLSNMLSFLSPGRTLVGIDSDPDKIALAQTGFALDAQVRFICGDPTSIKLPESEVMIISLNALSKTPNPSESTTHPKETELLRTSEASSMRALLIRCAAQLPQQGILIVRHTTLLPEWLDRLDHEQLFRIPSPESPTPSRFIAFRKQEGTNL